MGIIPVVASLISAACLLLGQAVESTGIQDISQQEQKSKATTTVCAEGSNITVGLAADGVYREEYDSDVYAVARKENQKGLEITVTKIGSPKDLHSRVFLYLPADALTNGLELRAEQAGIGVEALDCDIHLVSHQGSVGLTVPKGYSHTLTAELEKSSGSIVLEEGLTDYTLLLHTVQSAVSVPERFGTLPDIQYQEGSGAARISITVTESSFALVG